MKKKIIIKFLGLQFSRRDPIFQKLMGPTTPFWKCLVPTLLSSLNDKPNGIYILPTAPMPTEKLITYLPTYDKTILYVMITLVSINLMILLYKFLTRKLQHSTIALELSTGHRCITHPLINVPLCAKMYHYLARENFSHMKVEGWIRPMLLWERGQITIVNFLDHSELQIPQKTFVSVCKESN